MKTGHSSFLLLFSGFPTGVYSNMVLCQNRNELPSGGICHDVLNRGNARQDVFHEDVGHAPHGPGPGTFRPEKRSAPRDFLLSSAVTSISDKVA